MNSYLPILYSFRRCPYAMRARMALSVAGVQYDLREVVLQNKPDDLLQVSPKGTVPVLVLPEQVLEQSWDIMLWALRQNDPENWLGAGEQYVPVARSWLAENDEEFKSVLDRYKYHDRYPEQSQIQYWQEAQVFLEKIDRALGERLFLLAEQISVADVVLLPFIRQLVFVDQARFDALPYISLQSWLRRFISSPRFIQIMEKR